MTGGPSTTTHNRPGARATRDVVSSRISGVASPPDTADIEAVTASWCFDSGANGDPFSTTIRFEGRRVGVTGKPNKGDQFVRNETVDGIIPGSGLVSVTTQAESINPGEWSVKASMVDTRQAGIRPRPGRPRRHNDHGLSPAVWSWRQWSVSPGTPQPVKSRWAPLAPLSSRPAVVPGSWPGFVVLGVIVGLVTQNQILASEQLPTGRALNVSLLATFVGFAGARIWYLVLHRTEQRRSFSAGWCIQGFLAGFAATVAIALPLADLPVGRFFDATAPGMFIGLAVGRLGCFFTGCCAGRATASRWGIWSSDRRIGARRLPTQLLESLTAAAVGVATWVIIGRFEMPVHGALFVGALATYTLIRQFLLRLRAQPRNSILVWKVTVAAATLVLAADLAVLVKAR